MCCNDSPAVMDLPAAEVPPTFVDVFAGCGGLTLGLMRAGWHGTFVVEKDPFAFSTLEANFLQGNSRYRLEWPEWLAKEACDIRALLKTHDDELSNLRGSIDLLAGGPPCQGFSSAGRRKAHDPRNQLFRDYVALVELVQPRLILLENVAGITYTFRQERAHRRETGSRRSDQRETYSEAITRTLADNYHVVSSIVSCSAFGIPQSRPRFILVGYSKKHFEETRVPRPFEQIEACRVAFLAAKGLRCRTTAKQALSDLEIRRNGLVDGDGAPRFKSIGYKRPLSRLSEGNA